MNIEHLYRLAVMYRADYPPQLSVTDASRLLNRVAWDVSENGWGMLTDSVRHLANITTGETLELINDRGQIHALGVLHLEEDAEVASRFVDPTDPEIDHVVMAPPTTAIPGNERGPYGHDNPPPGYGPCTRKAGHEGPCAMPLALAVSPPLSNIDPETIPDKDTLPADIREALAAVEKRVLGLSNMWQEIVQQIGVILDRSNDELEAIRGLLDRGFEGTATIMGIKVNIVIRPIQAPVTTTEQADPAPVDTETAQS